MKRRVASDAEALAFKEERRARELDEALLESRRQLAVQKAKMDASPLGYHAQPAEENQFLKRLQTAVEFGEAQCRSQHARRRRLWAKMRETKAVSGLAEVELADAADSPAKPASKATRKLARLNPATRTSEQAIFEAVTGKEEELDQGESSPQRRNSTATVTSEAEF